MTIFSWCSSYFFKVIRKTTKIISNLFHETKKQTKFKGHKNENKRRPYFLVIIQTKGGFLSMTRMHIDSKDVFFSSL